MFAQDVFTQDADLLFLMMQFLGKGQTVRQMRLHTVSKAWRAAVSLLLRMPSITDSPLEFGEERLRSDEELICPEPIFFDYLEDKRNEVLESFERFLAAMLGDVGFPHRKVKVTAGKHLRLARFCPQMEILTLHCDFDSERESIVDLRPMKQLRTVHLHYFDVESDMDYDLYYAYFRPADLHKLFPAPNTVWSVLLPSTVQKLCVSGEASLGHSKIEEFYIKVTTLFPSLLEFSISTEYFGGRWKRESCDTPWQSARSADDVRKSVQLHSVYTNEKAKVDITALPNLRELYCGYRWNGLEDSLRQVHQRIVKLRPPNVQWQFIAQMLADGDFPELREIFLDSDPKVFPLMEQASRRGIKISFISPCSIVSPLHYDDQQHEREVRNRNSNSAHQILRKCTVGNDWSPEYLEHINNLIQMLQLERIAYSAGDCADYLLAMRCSRITSLSVSYKNVETLDNLDKLLTRFRHSLREYKDRGYTDTVFPSALAGLTALSFLSISFSLYMALVEQSPQLSFASVSVLHVENVKSLDELLKVVNTVRLYFPALHGLIIDAEAYTVKIASYIMNKTGSKRGSEIDSSVIARECSTVNLQANNADIQACAWHDDVGLRVRVCHHFNLELTRMLTEAYGTPVRACVKLLRPRFKFSC